jgi:hypothetical protein
MEHFLPIRGERILDRQPRELVPESHASGDRCEHARRESLLESVDRVADKRIKEPELGLARHDGHRVEQRPRARAEPRRAGKHRVAHGVRDLIRLGRKRFRHEERVAARPAIERLGVHTSGRGELRDRGFRERRQRQPIDRVAPRQFPEHHP